MNLSLSKHYIVVAPKEFNDDPILKKLVKDFKDYKNGKHFQFPIFGRDAPFSENKQLSLSKVSKVHVFSEDDMYDKNKSQFENTTDGCHLVYCEHFNDPNFLCVLAILHPEAHKQARNNNIIDSIVKRAETFHKLDSEKYMNKSA